MERCGTEYGFSFTGWDGVRFRFFYAVRFRIQIFRPVSLSTVHMRGHSESAYENIVQPRVLHRIWFRLLFAPYLKLSYLVIPGAAAPGSGSSGGDLPTPSLPVARSPANSGLRTFWSCDCPIRVFFSRAIA